MPGMRRTCDEPRADSSDLNEQAMHRDANAILDELLVLRAQGGDARSMELLYARVQPRLLRQAIHLTSHDDAASDICQDAWLAIIRGMRRLNDPAAFRSWAASIVTRRCADWVRSRRRQRTLNRHVAGESAAAAPTRRDSSEPRHDPSDQIDDDLTQLRGALGRMPGEQRALLTMHYLEGMGTLELARALSIPRGTVKSRLFHAREQLRLLLERKST